MNKFQVIEAYNGMLSAYDLCTLNVLVGAGAALVVQGLRADTNDIDVSVGRTLFQWIKSNCNPNIHYFDHGDGTVVEVLNDPAHPSIDFHLESPWEEGEMVEGVYCYTLETNLALKTKLGRKKDLADIHALQCAILVRG